MLRSVTLNLQGFNEEGEQDLTLIPKMESDFKKLGLTLYGQNGQLKSTFDIFNDLSGVWKDLDANTRNYYASLIGGKTQVDVVNSIISNFQTAIDANKAALNNLSPAWQENERYMESVAASVSQLKAEFQDLANNIAGSDILKRIVDMGTALLKFANTDIGTTIIQIGLFTTALTGVSKVIKAMTVGNTALNRLGLYFETLGFAMNTAVGISGKLNIALTGLFQVIRANPIMAAVTAGMALYKVFNSIAGASDKAKEKTQNLFTELEGLNSKLKDSETAYSTTGDPTRLDDLREEISLQKELISLKEQEIAQSYQEEYDKSVYGDSFTSKFLRMFQGFEDSAEKIKSYNTALKTLSYEQENGGKKVDYYTDSLKKQEDEIIESAVELLNLKNHGVELKDTDEELISLAQKITEAREKQNGVTSKSSQTVFALSLVTQQFASSLKVEGDAYVFVTEAAKEAARVQKQNEYDKTEATLKQVQARIAAYQSEANAQLALAGDGGIESYGYSKRDLARLKNQIAQQKAQGVDTSQLEKKYADYQTYYSTKDSLQLIKNQLKAIDDIGVSTGGTGDSISTGSSGGGSSVKTAQEKAEESLKAQHEAYQKIISDMEYQLYIAEKNGASDEERIQMMQKIQEMLLSQRAVYEKQGLASNHEYIQELNKQWWSYADDIKDIQDKITENVKKAQEEQLENLKNSLDAQLELLRYFKDERVSAVDEQIAQLEKEKDALKERNDEIADGIELQRLEDALQAAKQKKVRIWKSGIGWTYEQDVEAVRQAQEKLDEYKRNQQQEAEEKRIDEEIAKLEDYKQQWEDVVNNYEKQQNILLNEQTIGKNKEYQNIKDRIKNLEDFKNEYTRIINEINNLQIRQNYMGTGAGAGLSSDGGGSSSSSTDNRSNQKKYLDNLVSSGTAGQKKWAQSQIAQGKYATGSLSVPQSGLSLVGEQGRELRVLNQGDGIIPNKLTENLMNLGRYNIPQLASIMNTVNQKDSSNNMNIQNLTVALPNIRDNSSVETIQRALLDLPNKLKQKAYSI